MKLHNYELLISIFRLNICPKVKFKVTHISTGIISKIFTDRANIITAIEYEVIYGFSIGIFRFDPCPLYRLRSRSRSLEISLNCGRYCKHCYCHQIWRRILGFWLAYLDSIVAHSKGHLGCWKCLSPNILAFYLLFCSAMSSITCTVVRVCCIRMIGILYLNY